MRWVSRGVVECVYVFVVVKWGGGWVGGGGGWVSRGGVESGWVGGGRPGSGRIQARLRRMGASLTLPRRHRGCTHASCPARPARAGLQTTGAWLVFSQVRVWGLQVCCPCCGCQAVKAQPPLASLPGLQPLRHATPPQPRIPLRRRCLGCAAQGFVVAASARTATVCCACHLAPAARQLLDSRPAAAALLQGTDPGLLCEAYALGLQILVSSLPAWEFGSYAECMNEQEVSEPGQAVGHTSR